MAQIREENIIVRLQSEVGQLVSDLKAAKAEGQDIDTTFKQIAQNQKEAFRARVIQQFTEAMQKNNVELAEMQVLLQKVDQEIEQALSNVPADQLSVALKKLNKEFDRLNDPAGKLSTSLKNLGKEAAQLDSNNKKVSQSIKLTANEAKNLGFQLQDVFVQLASGQGIFRTLLFQGPQITSIFGGLGNTMKFFGQQALGALKSLFSLRGGLASLAVAATALIAVPLGAYFAKSGKAAEFMSVVNARASASMGVLFERFAGFGQVIANATRGQASFRDVMQAGIASVRGFWTEVDQAADSAQRLQIELNKINKDRAQQEILNIALARNAQLLNIQAEDQNKSIRERIGLIRRAAALEQEARDEQINSIRRELALLAANRQFGEDFQKLTLQSRKLQSESEVASAQTQARINALLRDSSEKAKKEAEEAAKKYEELRKKQAEFFKSLSDEEKAFRPDNILESIQILNERFIELVANAEKLRSDGLIDETDLTAALLLFEQLQEKGLKPLLEELEKFGNFADLGLSGRAQRQRQQEAKDALKQAGDAVERFKQRIAGDELDDFTTQMKRLEEIEGVAEVLSSVGEAIGKVSEAIRENNQQQIEAIDESISRQRDRVQAVTAIAEQGNAELLQLEEERLARLEQAKERAVQRDRQLAAVSLAINQAVAVSNAIVALTQALATPGVGTFEIIAKGVALAATLGTAVASISGAFQELPRFREGTPELEGPGTGTSDSIIARLSRGERVVDAETNRQLGGRKVSNEELLETFNFGRRMQAALPELLHLNMDRVVVNNDYRELDLKLSDLTDEVRKMRGDIRRQRVSFNITREGIHGAAKGMEAEIERRKTLLR